jgi:hypothetical protein
MEYVRVMDWQPTFVAMSVALGESPEAVLAHLGSNADAVSAELHLRSENRLQKAKALAAALGALALEIERAEEAWPS